MDTIKHGTHIVSPFSPLSDFPIDGRFIVDSYADLQNIDTVYNGLITYIKNENTFYKFINNEWELLTSEILIFQNDVDDTKGSNGDIALVVSSETDLTISKNGFLYKKENNTWVYTGSLRGPEGKDGPIGRSFTHRGELKIGEEYHGDSSESEVDLITRDGIVYICKQNHIATYDIINNEVQFLQYWSKFIGKGESFNYKGQWNSIAEIYKYNDIVKLDGKVYLCIKAHTSSISIDPSDNNEYWQILVENGDQGEIGPQGEPGPQGPQGEPGPQGPRGEHFHVDYTCYTKDELNSLADNETVEEDSFVLYQPTDIEDEDYGKLYQKVSNESSDDEGNITIVYSMEYMCDFIGPRGPRGDIGATGRSGELTLYGSSIEFSDVATLYFKVMKRKEVY